jgi:peptide/nickel transport system permease protein
MGKYILSKLLWVVPAILAILLINFLIIHLVPGDPVQAILGDFPVPPEYMARIKQELGLDQSVTMQLWLYLLHLFQGNLGFSFANRQPVLDLILIRSVYTLMIMIPALVAASIIGLVLAMLAAPRAGGVVDTGITCFSLFGHSVPVFWLAQLLVLLFAVVLGWLPAQGMMSLRRSPTGWAAFADTLQHLILPALCMTVYYIAIVARVARVSVINVLSQDFVLTARAKGLSRSRVLWRHVLPNALIPVVTVIGYNFASSLTGAILVETVFAWPGLGSLFISSIANRDYPVLQGIFLLTAITVILANLITDIAYALLDPRVRRRYESSHA